MAKTYRNLSVEIGTRNDIEMARMRYQSLREISKMSLSDFVMVAIETLEKERTIDRLAAFVSNHYGDHAWESDHFAAHKLFEAGITPTIIAKKDNTGKIHNDIEKVIYNW